VLGDIYTTVECIDLTFTGKMFTNREA